LYIKHNTSLLSAITNVSRNINFMLVKLITPARVYVPKKYQEKQFLALK